MDGGYALSQITVAYENREDLINTLRSVSGDFPFSREIIIKDGSAQALLTVDEVRLLTGVEQVVYLHGPDRGAYDAMNQAMDACSGEYVWFLNSGDLLEDGAALNEAWGVLLAADRPCLGVFGWKVNGKVVPCPCRAENIVAMLRYRWAARHQSMLFRRSCIDRLRYDLKYRITADRKLMLEMLLRNAGSVVVAPDCVLTNNDSSGVCRTNIIKKENENIVMSFEFFTPRSAALAMARYIARLGRYFLISILQATKLAGTVRR